MKHVLLSLSLSAVALSACTPTDQATLTGAVAGGALGAAVSDDDDRTQGALLGAAAGAVVGTLIGRSNQPGQCVYEDRYGERYLAPC